MSQQLRTGRFLWGGLSCLTVAAIGITAAVLWLPYWNASESHGAVGSQMEQMSQPRMVGNKVVVTSEVVRTLGIKTELAQQATKPHALPALTGCLALDSNTLARIPPRFPGEIVAVGTLNGGEKKVGAPKESGSGDDRPLRYGDHVKAGQLLAVLWSKDLGEKKSEFVDGLCKLKLDTEKLERLEKSHKEGIVPEQSLWDARYVVQGDINAVKRAESTLRSWRLSDDDIAALRKEAANVESPQGNNRSEFENWARVEIRAPQDGVIVEMNLSLGSLVNDTNADLFKIADTKRLMVWANVYEDDLPLLSGLAKKGRLPWNVRVASQSKNNGYAGHMEQIGEMIDPNQHTALVMGFVNNPNHELKAGQYVTIGIELPAANDEIEIRTTALVEDGEKSVIFVQPDPSRPEFEQRKVTVSRRYHDVVYVYADALQPGEAVIVRGALLLNDAINEQP